MAGLGYSLDFTTRGVRLSFGGFGDKMPDFIARIAEAIATHSPEDPQEFERLRDVVRKEEEKNEKNLLQYVIPVSYRYYVYIFTKIPIRIAVTISIVVDDVIDIEVSIANLYFYYLLVSSLPLLLLCHWN